MRKHFYIFIAVLLVASAGLAYFWKSIDINNVLVSWEISGDQELFDDLDFSFEVYSGRNYDHWNVSTSPSNGSVCDSYYSESDQETMDKALRKNANLNHYTFVNRHFSLSGYESNMTSWDGSKHTVGESSVYIDFYKSYIDKALEQKEFDYSGDELALDKITDNLIVELELDDEKSSIVFPTPKNIMVTPLVKYGNYADSDEDYTFDQAIDLDGYWYTYLSGLEDYRFDIVQGCVNNEEYMAISFCNMVEADDADSFTYIYQLTSDAGKSLLDEPKLIKQYDCYQNIVYIGESNGTAFMLLTSEGQIKISSVDIESFDVINTYIKTLNNYEGYYKEVGICNLYNYNFLVYDSCMVSDILHFDSDKLYIASFFYGGEVNDSFVEILALEPENDQPLVRGIMYCNLFQLINGYSYDLGDIIREGDYCAFNLNIKKTFN